jgi:hypothetical protein
LLAGEFVEPEVVSAHRVRSETGSIISDSVPAQGGDSNGEYDAQQGYPHQRPMVGDLSSLLLSLNLLVCKASISKLIKTIRKVSSMGRIF